MTTDNRRTETCNLKIRKKNAYVKLQQGAYPHIFREQVEEALATLVTGKLGCNAGMVRINKRSREYEVRLGYGARLRWFCNRFIQRGEVASFASRDGAETLLQEILAAAVAGEFDEALESIRIQAQEHADTMIKARNSCGFHRKEPDNVDTESGART